MDSCARARTWNVTVRNHRVSAMYCIAQCLHFHTACSTLRTWRANVHSPVHASSQRVLCCL